MVNSKPKPKSKSKSKSKTSSSSASSSSRYESQKRRDWNTFGQYLHDHHPPFTVSHCNSSHVIDFLKYLDQFGKTKVHTDHCPFFAQSNPSAPCACPMRQAWGSLDALVGRLRAAYEDTGGMPEGNPFAGRAVGFYLLQVKDSQAKARGVSFEKKKRKRSPEPQSSTKPEPPPSTMPTPTSS